RFEVGHQRPQPDPNQPEPPFQVARCPPRPALAPPARLGWGPRGRPGLEPRARPGPRSGESAIAFEEGGELGGTAAVGGEFGAGERMGGKTAGAAAGGAA